MHIFWTADFSFAAVTAERLISIWRQIAQAYLKHQERRIILDIEPRLRRDIGLDW